MTKTKFEKYDDYKASGVKWLDEIPAHWSITHLKRFCKNITDGAHSSPDLSSDDYPFLTVVNLKNGKLDFENCLFTSAFDYDNLVRNGCQPYKNDVLYSKDGTISETVVIQENRKFVVGSSFIIIRPIKKNINSSYLCYFLSSSIMLYQARIYVKGVSLPRLSIFNITKLISILPPLVEQTAIAKYLDEKTSLIDSKINLLTQKAEQYTQLKQSLINETVTRGLDKTVPLKDSGVAWIGKMPKHWELFPIRKLLYNSTKKNIGNKETEYLSLVAGVGVIPYAEKGNIGNKRPDDLEKCKLVNPGDFVLNSMNFGLGSFGISRYKGVCSSVYIVLRPIKNNYGEFLYRIFEVKPFQLLMSSFGKGIMEIRMAIRWDDLKNIYIPYPPISEQQNIASFLDERTNQIDIIVTTISSQINKLKELRKTLINDVVTGKIKVYKEGKT